MGNNIAYFCFSYFKYRHLTLVDKIKGFLNKISAKVAYSLIGIYVVYLIVTAYKIYDQSQTPFRFLKGIWAYPLYNSSAVTITLGKSVLLIGFLLFSFFLARIIVNKILHRFLEKTKLDIGARSAIENLSSYILTFIFIVIALSVAEIPLAAFTFIGGALAIGVGFGTQNILNNFISGIILQTEKPIKVGDHIELDAIIKGRVEEIGTRSTKIVLANNTHMIVPNSVLLEKPVNNWSFKDQTYRCKITFQYQLSSDHKKVMSVLESVLLKHKSQIKQFPSPQIYLSEVNAQGQMFEMFFWINRESTARAKLESDIRLEVLDESSKSGLEFFFQK